MSARFSLQGKVALVTGASSGIGRTVAKALADCGASVVAAARRGDRLADLVEEITASGSQALAVAMDVTQATSVAAAYDLAEQTFGTVDVIINNAGIAEARTFLKTDTDSMTRVMDTNFKGVWQVAQEGAKRLVAAGKPGCIINIASVLGIAAHPGQTAYGASKAAVIQFTRSLSLDLMKHNIRVNAIAPGWFRTEINEDFFDTEDGKDYIRQMPSRRLGELDELVGPIIMLASDAGSFVNGVVLPVDGAHTARLV